MTGLSIATPDSSGRFGLFGQIAAQGVVTNLVLTNVTVSCSSPPALLGLVCGRNLGTVAFCSAFGKVKASFSANGAGSAMGGVCGANAGTVRACCVEDTLAFSVRTLDNDWDNMAVGGIAGTNAVSGTIESCLFYGRYANGGGAVVHGAVCGANAGTIRDCVGVHDNSNYFGSSIGSNTGTAENTTFPDAGTNFTGGAACYTLNGGVTNGTQVWYQTIDVDALPQLSATPVPDATVYKHGPNYCNVIVHDWRATWEHSPDYSNGTWTAVCAVGGETVTLSATGTCAVTTQPACTSPGETTWTYLPPANDYGFTVTNAVLYAPAALGHAWGVSSYFWAADGSTATASNACTVCGAPFVETVDAVCVVIREPTHTVPGEKSCTATFASPLFTEQTTVVAIPVLPPPITYIDENGEEREREGVECIALTNAAGDATYGTAGEEAWYVVTNDVSIGGKLLFKGSTNHLIVCDGATLAITNTSGDAIHSDGSLSIYGQADGTGTLDLKGGEDAIQTQGLTINGGIVNVNSKYGIYLSSSSALTINGGVMNAIGTSYGIYSFGSVTFGWRTPTDSIYVSSYNNSSSGNIYVKLGQTLIDDDGNIYTGDGNPFLPSDLAGKTLRPSIPTPTFNDPQGNEIQDSGVVAWLSDNGFTQADIDALGNDSAATDKLYACFLLNCDFTVQGAGATLSITGIAVTNGVVSITVQLERKAPLGAIHGVLNLYGATDLAAGFGRSPIAAESISFGAGDSTFATAPDTGLVIQSVTATLSVSDVSDRFFKAVIKVSDPNEP